MTDRQSGGATQRHRGTATRDTTDMSDTTGDTDTAGKMKEMDHAPPVEGAKRSFERRREGHPPRTDGGRDGSEDAAEEATEEADPDEEGAAPDGGFAQKMKEMDHTPPVDGAKRTFERGRDDDGDSDGVRE